MPTYTYRCDNGHRYSEHRPMSEPQQRTECPDCTSPLKRVWDTPPISFKGKGFYSTGG